MTVHHGYLPGARPLFGSYHVPRAPSRDIAWVVCPPHGWESIQCQESMRKLADELADGGFHVLRLHYDGTGESPGSDRDEGRVGAWLASVRVAVDAMRGIEGVRGVGLVGIRLGATLAGVAARDAELAGLVLWEPCVTGAQFAREMEILASASPRAVKAEGDATTSHGVEAGGNLLTRATVTELAGLDLMAGKPLGAPDVLVLCREDRPPIAAKKLVAHLAREGSAAVLEQMPGFKEMMTYPERAVPASAMIGRIRAWAAERAGSAAAMGTLTLASSADHAGTRRSPVRFGPEARLFGVLTEPRERASASTPKRPVVMLTGGVVPRTSVNGMYVEMADLLAARGHTVLRLDVSGICESPPAPGAAPNDPHAKSLLEDVHAAVELTLAATGAREIALLGLCSGAYASYQTALTDARVRRIVLLNPEVFHLADGSPKFSETEQSLATSYYKQALRDPAAWKKLLSGKANLRYIAGFVRARAKTTMVRAKERLEARLTDRPQGLAGEMVDLLARGLAITVVMAEGDTGHAALMAQLEADLPRLRRDGFVLDLTPGPDHTFNDFSVREPLVTRLVATLAS